MANEIIVGLDIGTTKIACFVGMRGENGKVKILGFGKTESIGVEHGVVRGITQTAESITKAVRSVGWHCRPAYQVESQSWQHHDTARPYSH